MRPERLVIVAVMGACTIAASAASWRAAARAPAGWLVTFGGVCIAASLAPPLVIAWVTSVGAVLLASIIIIAMVADKFDPHWALTLVVFLVCTALGSVGAWALIGPSSMRLINPGGATVMVLVSLLVLDGGKTGIGWRRLWRMFRAMRLPRPSMGWSLLEGRLLAAAHDPVDGAPAGAVFAESNGLSLSTPTALQVQCDALRSSLKVVLVGGKDRMSVTWRRKEVRGPLPLYDGTTVAAGQVAISESLPVGQTVTVFGNIEAGAAGVVECMLHPFSEGVVYDCDLETAWRRAQADVVGATWYALCALGYLLSQLFAHWL